MINHDFTGQSTTSYDEAIMHALYAANEFLTNMQNAHVNIKELWQDPSENYNALLEVTKDPLAPAYTDEEFEEDEKLGDNPNADKKYRFFRRKGYASIRALIADHFKKKGQAVPSGIPDFIIAHLTAVDIENNAIEKDFLFAAEAMPMPVEGDMPVASPHVEEEVMPPEIAPVPVEQATPAN